MKLPTATPHLRTARAVLPGAGAATSEAERLAARNAARPNWYSTARWQKLRLRALDRDGWRCRQTGVLLVGSYPAPNSAAVDHIKPHGWDPELFWCLDNLQSVTKAWHDREKQRRERAVAQAPLGRGGLNPSNPVGR